MSPEHIYVTDPTWHEFHSVFCGLDFRLLQSRPFTNSQFHFLISVQCNE